MSSTMKPPGSNVEAVFAAAQSFSDVGEREAYLRVACKGDKALRQRVEELLAAAEEARAFFADPATACAASTADTAMFQKPGAVMRYFGDYEVEEEIGRGGMGVIYRARQTSLNRKVAVKMILSGSLANETEVRRFQAEAEAAANLRHPNIVSIHEIGVHAGQRYFSMDLVEGGSLADRIRQSPLSPGDAADALKTIAEAVAYAHSRGILHRDLKPQNILLDEGGRPHVTDFGLAKRMESDSQLTLSGHILGSPGFMAPEQARGNRSPVDGRTDVYGLGALLYAMLTGHAPIQGDNVADTIRRVTEEDPTPPHRLNPKVAPDLETICLKCLAKSPAERYASAQEVADDLERFLNYEPVEARPVGAVRKTWTWWQKNPWKLVGILGVLALAMVGCITALWERNQLAATQLQYPDADVRLLFTPFERSPAIGFLTALPAWMILIFVTGRAFRRQLRGTGSRELLRSVGLPVHAICGAAVFGAAITFLLQQIRYWVWRPGSAPLEMFMVGLDAAASLACFVLAWIGLTALWEALGSHDSALFKARVSEHLEREFETEAERKWTFGHLLLVSGSLIIALLLATVLLFVVMDYRGKLPAGVSGSTLLGVAMTFAAHLVRRRLPTGMTARRLFWFAIITLFFLATVVAFVRMAPLAPLTFGWMIGLMFATAHLVFARVIRRATGNDTGADVIAAPRSWYRLRLATESFAVLAALFVLFHLIENRRGDQAWSETQRAIAKAGVHLDPQAEQPPPIPDADNFFMALNQDMFLRRRTPSGGFQKLNGQAFKPIPDPHELLHPRAFKKAFEPGPFVDLTQVVKQEAAQNDGLPPASREQVRKWLTRHEDFFSRIVTAARRPGAQFPHERNKPLRFQPLPNFQVLQAMTRAFAVRTQFAIDQGDGAGALENIRVISQTRHMLRTSPSLVSTMIAIRMAELEAGLVREGLRRQVWSTAQLKDVQARLALEPPLRSFGTCLHAEMAWIAELAETVTIAELIVPHRWRRNREWFWRWIDAATPRGWKSQMKSRMARVYLDAVLPVVDSDAHRIRLEHAGRTAEALARLAREKSLLNVLALIGIPNVHKAVATAGCAQALLDMTRIACAAERFKTANGEFPRSLAELAPKWIAALPPDVVNGEPLRYRANPDGGFTLYSRALNQKDDDGHAGYADEDPKDWVWSR